MDNQEILDRLAYVEGSLHEHCYHNDIKFEEIDCKIRDLECMNEALINCIQKIEAAMPRVIELLQEEAMPINLSALEKIM